MCFLAMIFLNLSIVIHRIRFVREILPFIFSPFLLSMLSLFFFFYLRFFGHSVNFILLKRFLFTRSKINYYYFPSVFPRIDVTFVKNKKEWIVVSIFKLFYYWISVLSNSLRFGFNSSYICNRNPLSSNAQWLLF